MDNQRLAHRLDDQILRQAAWGGSSQWQASAYLCPMERSGARSLEPWVVGNKNKALSTAGGAQNALKLVSSPPAPLIQLTKDDRP
jgi:hypothetical protein